MSDNYISKLLRQKVAAQAKYRCGYCLTQEKVIGAYLEIEHIKPKARGGATIEHNLWLACSPCNDAKNDRVSALDPLTKDMVDLFNPRTQIWKEHFAWSENGLYIRGLTSIERTTIAALNMNRLPVITSRMIWFKAGLHPPED